MSSVDLITELGRWLDELARKWERFLTHDPQVPLPPERERAALERRLMALSREEFRTAADSFHLQQLLHRFSTFNLLWQRQLREREEARRVTPVIAAHPNAPARPPVLDPEAEYERLHGSYVAALAKAGSKAGVSLARFREALEAQRRTLEERGAVVEGFDVVAEGAQVKVRARVRRGRS